MPSRRAQIRMSEEEARAFLGGSHTMTLATLRPDGQPHLVAMWYGFLDGDVAFWTYGKSQKVRNLRRDPRLTCLVESGRHYEELKGVSLEGTGDILEEWAQWPRWGLTSSVATAAPRSPRSSWRISCGRPGSAWRCAFVPSARCPGTTPSSRFAFDQPPARGGAMHKFTVTYTRPEDEDGFLDHYENTHMPIVHRWPNVNAVRRTTYTGTPRGGESDVWLQLDVLFDSEDQLHEAMRSDAGRESGKDLMQMIERFGVEAKTRLGHEENFGPGGERPTAR